ncbi:ATP-dependent DNA helicase [Lachnoclostridium sp. Marseille-P6806]|uniref:ATP-dependent DNA helicase n=1 Tax=Lachnoclostridium sp. Marseille-P6806 TaxID=2364793 RepID=UPI0010326AFB|nr:ATP-dependent DNA helicase [Lachnoclostridium sp. Marseille-P6806]
MTTEMRVSVRSLVEFVLRNGDLDNRAGAAPEEAMLAGARMHRRLQKQAGPDYQPEVSLCCRWEYTEPNFRPFSVLVEGRADGIFTGRLPDDPASEEGPVIDEIKSTYRNLARMTEPDPVHLAQARCYAWMYCAEQGAEFVYVRLSYVNLDNEDIHYFYERQTREELAAWFGALMREYRKWAEYALGWLEKRQNSIRALAFPFPYREGQRELMGHVYRTIVRGRKLFLEAPTGTGKTIAALFPALKAMGEGKAERIFYLTARTVAGAVAEDTLQLCRAGGLAAKSVTLTAKEKLCVLGRPDCNPDACPRAQGHYDRINRAIYELLTQADHFDRGTIAACAEKHNVCPFEMTLDMSLFSDVVIGDYNYVFDPHVYLRRFFGEGELRRAYLFLVDEAHNLVDRGREMYSAAIDQGFLESMEAVLRGTRSELADGTVGCLLALGALRRRQQTEALLVRGEDETATFHDAVTALHGRVGKWLEEERRRARRRVRKPSRRKKELQEKILNLYFELSHYLLIRELMDEHYRIYTEFADGSFRIRLFCVDPGRNLQRCMDRGVSSILFSATLLPIQYYKKLLGGGAEDYEVYAHSVFDPERRALLIVRDVTSRYARRGPEQYDRLARGIHYMTSGRHGNYLVFFPSFVFLREVAEVYARRYQDASVTECICQQERMDEAARSAFLARFAQSSDEHTLIGFAVLGGIFSEGIDLRRDSLIGAAVVGTGIPQICGERELLREYFNETGVNGYDYAYCFPGMNKVMQAAGRVIRTQQDIGVIALLDERFLTSGYRRLFPREWSDYEEISTEELPGRIDRFWNEWL